GPARLPQQRARFVHVGGIAGKRHRQVIDLQGSRGTNVVPVLVRQGAGGQPAALAIDALVVAEFAADQDAGADARSLHAEDLQADLSIVEQQDIAGEHVRRKLLVGDSDRLIGAGIDGEAGIQGEVRAVGEFDLSGREAIDANFWAREVAQYADVASRPRGSSPHQIETARVV